MEVVFQPKDSMLCGQCCVAIVSGADLENVIKIFGHKRGTTTRELAKAFQQLGIEADLKLAVFKKESALPKLCILKQAWPGRRTWHWVVYRRGRILCPTHGKYKYKNASAKTAGRFTSYLSLYL